MSSTTATTTTTATIGTTAATTGTTRDTGRKMIRTESSLGTILISTLCPLTPLQRQLSGNCHHLEDDDDHVEGEGVDADVGVDEVDGDGD